MARPLRDLGAALREVFVRPAYALLAAAVAACALLLAIWLPNVALLAAVFGDGQAPLRAKLGIALSLLAGIATNFDLLSGAYTIAIAALLGIDVAMVAYLLTHRRGAGAARNVALGSGGVASGVVGIGCAACGSLLLGGIAPVLGIAGALAALPLHGEEFGILSVALLCVSLLLVGQAIAGPGACALEQGSG